MRVIVENLSTQKKFNRIVRIEEGQKLDLLARIKSLYLIISARPVSKTIISNNHEWRRKMWDRLAISCG